MAAFSLLRDAVVRAEQLYEQLGPDRAESYGRLTVVPYLSHGNRDRVVLRGRVLADRPLGPTTRVEPIARRTLRMARRFFTREVPGVRLDVQVGAAHATTVTDDEGYWHLEVEGHELPADRLLHRITVTPQPNRPVPVDVRPAHVAVPTDRARRLVISDIDDTIMHSEAFDTSRLVKRTATGSAWTRRAFPGTAELYAGLERGPGLDEQNLVAYLSSSAWNLYDFLVSFLDYHNLPQGTLCLRDLGIDREKLGQSAHGVHKSANIDAILTAHPDLNFVLVGDSGQHDPEIYASAVERHPGRIKAIFIRDVTGLKRREELTHLARELKAEHGVKMMLETDLLEPAKFAARKGWCDPRYVDDIRAAIERARDEPLELPPRRVFTKQTRRLLIAAGVGAAVATGVILWKRYQHEN